MPIAVDKRGYKQHTLSAKLFAPRALLFAFSLSFKDLIIK